jgi:uncharacterized membrane protein YbaN (DUF454 family)
VSSTADLPAPRKSRLRRSKAWNLALAIFFFVLGAIGLAIPVMPQFIFFAMGFLFLSLVSPTVRRKLRSFLHRHPALAHRYKRWRDQGRRKRLEMIRRRKEFAEKLHLHRHGPAPPGSGVPGGPDVPSGPER